MQWYYAKAHSHKEIWIFAVNKHKIFVAGDSHVSGCFEKVLNRLGDSYSATGLSKLNADLNAIISCNFKMENFLNNYVVIICREIRDTGRNDTKAGLHSLTYFTKRIVSTNIILLGAHHNFNLEDILFVNKAVIVFNRKVQKVMKIFWHVRILNLSTNRRYYTRCGLHINSVGKTWITSKIERKIKDLFWQWDQCTHYLILERWKWTLSLPKNGLQSTRIDDTFPSNEAFSLMNWLINPNINSVVCDSDQIKQFLQMWIKTYKNKETFS